MNARRSEEIYGNIGQIIASSIGEAWALAWMVAEIDPDGDGTAYGRYKTSLEPSSDIKYFEPEYDTYLLFKELREEISHPEHGHWNQAVFTMLPSGKFTIDFNYDSFDEEEDPWDRAELIDKAKAAQTTL